jgi:hypothetical protein
VPTGAEGVYPQEDDGRVSTTTDVEQALAVARGLVALGMPLFLAQPDPAERTGYRLPYGWQQARPDPSVVDAWRPGMALCAVTGHVLDLIDLDPRSGGELDGGALSVPVMAEAHTPSGGTHRWILPVGVESRDGTWPGVDVKSGAPDGTGRGFGFIAPTVRTSKVDGRPRAYRWEKVPDSGRIRDAVNYVRTHGNPSADPIRRRIAELRAERPSTDLPRRLPRSVARAEWDRAYDRLVQDLRHWAAHGWGGEAHAGLLAHTTHLARLSPDNAPAAFEAAFTEAGLTPDQDDLLKLDTAVSNAVPDVVIPDQDMPPQELFWAGAAVPLPREGDASGPSTAGLPSSDARAGYEFAPVTRDRFRNRKPAPAPVYGTFGRADGGLIYGQGVHWLQGESESGKSWVAQAVAAEVLRHEQPVLYVDYEHTEDGILERLEQLGVTDEEIERLTLVGGHDVVFRELVEHVTASDYALVIVDGVTSSLSSAGLSGRDEQELTRWTDLLPARARAAVCIDHVVKAVDDRRGMAVGTQAKKSVVTGAAWEVVATRKWGRGTDGTIRLNLQKDKPGALRGRADVVKLTFRSDPTSGQVVIAVPTALSTPSEAFFGQDNAAVRARAVYERIVAWETAGGAIPPKMSMRDMRKLVKEELNEQVGHEAMDEAIRMYKRAKGLPVGAGTGEP